ncbi:MAG: glycosyltransferase [Clostridia bacterium]|nr:glycosyltransferase [Clostridia bacterium]
MKLLYFGTVCDLNNYENILSESDEKSSVATIVFESSLLSGLKRNCIDVDIFSFPMIPTFPHSKLLWWGNRKENLDCGYKCTWLKTINVPIFKQLSRRLDGRRILKKWMKENNGQECAVLSYSMPPFLTRDIIKFSKKYGVKCFAVVTDLLRDMYINSLDNKVVSKLKNYYLSRAIRWQGEFDGYIYLTEEMKEVVNPVKPFIVMEGIADVSDTFATHKTDKAYPSAIMYAGMLEEKFGIFNLIDAFESAKLKDTELWLFGSGNAVGEILSREKNNQKIRFFGHKSRDEVLMYEKAATLLVNPRNVNDEFTKYSFPSKTIEYMLSGTPMLTTKLKGIPHEYYDYLFICENNDALSLKQGLEQAMSASSEERLAMGARARKFIIEEKNSTKQTNRIVQFITEVLMQ